MATTSGIGDISNTADVFTYDDGRFFAAWDADEAEAITTIWSGARLAVGLGSEPTILPRADAIILRDALTYWLDETGDCHD